MPVAIVHYGDWKRWREGLRSKPQGTSFPLRLLTAEGEAVLKVLTEFLGKPRYHGTGAKGTFFKWRLPADANEAPFHVACDALEERGLPRPALRVTAASPTEKYIRLRFPPDAPPSAGGERADDTDAQKPEAKRRKK